MVHGFSARCRTWPWRRSSLGTPSGQPARGFRYSYHATRPTVCRATLSDRRPARRIIGYAERHRGYDFLAPSGCLCRVGVPAAKGLLNTSPDGLQLRVALRTRLDAAKSYVEPVVELLAELSALLIIDWICWNKESSPGPAEMLDWALPPPPGFCPWLVGGSKELMLPVCEAS